MQSQKQQDRNISKEIKNDLLVFFLVTLFGMIQVKYRYINVLFIIFSFFLLWKMINFNPIIL